LLSHDAARAARFAPLDLHLADVKLRVEAPNDVLALLNTTLSSVPRFGGISSPDLTITVSELDEAWEIRGTDGRSNVLSPNSAMPQIGGAVISRVVSDVAATCDLRTMRAAVIERNGRALALVGDDWESAITLATHLHGRGWRFIGSDHALFDAATLQVHCVQKSLYVNATSVSHLPVKYRRAVEASPWYVTPRGMWFYAVNPTATGMHHHAWAPSAKLSGLLVVDGVMLDSPLIESIAPRQLEEDRLARLGIDWNAVGVADLRVGGYVETCDLVEHWFQSLQP
jgi:hypothetical protein